MVKTRRSHSTTNQQQVRTRSERRLDWPKPSQINYLDWVGWRMVQLRCATRRGHISAPSCDHRKNRIPSVCQKTGSSRDLDIPNRVGDKDFNILCGVMNTANLHHCEPRSEFHDKPPSTYQQPHSPPHILTHHFLRPPLRTHDTSSAERRNSSSKHRTTIAVLTPIERISKSPRHAHIPQLLLSRRSWPGRKEECFDDPQEPLQQKGQATSPS